MIVTPPRMPPAPRRARRPAGSRSVAWAACAALALSGPAAASAAGDPAAFKIEVVAPGVYRVGFEALVDAGLAARPVDSSRLGLTHLGLPVPIRLDDGGDGRFGPGDTLEFVGEHLQGDHSFFSEYSDRNVYRLALDAARPARMRLVGRAGSGGRCASRLVATERFELDRMRMRFASFDDDEQRETWYWAKLTHIDEEPFRLTIALPDLDPTAGLPVRLRIHLRGWSTLPYQLRDAGADHRVEVRLNGVPAGDAEWDNRLEGMLLELDAPPAAARAGENVLELRVPSRTVGEDPRPQVDVVMLNWVEIDYPRSAAVARGQATVAIADPGPGGCIGLDAQAGEPVVVFLDDGGWLATASALTSSGPTHHVLHADDGWPAGGRLHVVVGDAYLDPVELTVDRTAGLAATERQVDYVIIAHPRLLDAVEPLADFHRQRGLSVLVTDVTDVYDEFNHGIVHPRAIRDFLSHAYHRWKPPAPRFVLLVGDASWDARNATPDDRNYADKVFNPRHQTRLPKNASTPYGVGAEPDHRNLIPTWGSGSRDGEAASDNWFVDVEGDDDLPEMAIGRLPVTRPEEVETIVAKTVRYAERPLVGPWRRTVLWITNEHPYYQKRSNELADELGRRGFAARKVYPSADEASNEANTAELRRAFDEGELIVHFLGHGGRYIWRTGPPDLKKNHDLFTLDDVEALAPNPRLPIVISMTCYSAPFDHPTADSIGEKFLRLPDRGAVAVVAASWRNSPSVEMSRGLVERLTHPGTIGEAFLRAKRDSGNRDFVLQYNLLGDPAAPVAVPQLGVTLELRHESGPAVRATVEAADFAGRGLVEWLTRDDTVLDARDVVVSGGRFEVAYGGDPQRLGELAVVRAYVWDEATGRDGLGGLTVGAEDGTR